MSWKTDSQVDQMIKNLLPKTLDSEEVEDRIQDWRECCERATIPEGCVIQANEWFKRNNLDLEVVDCGENPNEDDLMWKFK